MENRQSQGFGWLTAISIVLFSISWSINVQSSEIPPAPGQMVDVGDHNLHIQCSGHGVGKPTIILEAGLGGVALEWSQVQTALAHDFRVCSYDRAGMGWSGGTAGARTSDQITAELHHLLQSAEIPGPYVLVGHSLGGYSAQLFASRYPHLSAGLVLVDSSHPEQIERFAAAPIRATIAPKGRLMHLMPVQVPAQLSAANRTIAQVLARAHKARIAVTRELEGFRASARQLTQAGSLPEVPLVVLTRGIQKWPTDERGNLKEQLWLKLQAELAHKTNLAAQIVAQRSGHHIHLDQPELVVAAIRVVAETAHQNQDQDLAVRQLYMRDVLPTATAEFGDAAVIASMPGTGQLLAMRTESF